MEMGCSDDLKFSDKWIAKWLEDFTTNTQQAVQPSQGRQTTTCHSTHEKRAESALVLQECLGQEH